MEVAGQDGTERGERLQRGDAASLRQNGQSQDVVVEERAGHVTGYGWEASCGAVHHLWEGAD